MRGHQGAQQHGMHTRAHAAEVSADARMTMVFDDCDRAHNSDEHLKHVAEQCALSYSLNIEHILVNAVQSSM